jgi:hypothetical protein
MMASTKVNLEPEAACLTGTVHICRSGVVVDDSAAADAEPILGVMEHRHAVLAFPADSRKLVLLFVVMEALAALLAAGRTRGPWLADVAVVGFPFVVLFGTRIEVRPGEVAFRAGFGRWSRLPRTEVSAELPLGPPSSGTRSVRSTRVPQHPRSADVPIGRA